MVTPSPSGSGSTNWRLRPRGKESVLSRTLRGAALALLLLISFAFSALAAPIDPHQTSAGATTAGLTMLDEGAAAYYSPSWDNGGWDQIVQRHADWGQFGPDFQYNTDGHWCVDPSFALGNIITLRNANTGATITCTIGDAVAGQDLAYWQARFVVEMSYRAFTDLGLADGNNVQVWYLPNG